MRPCIQQVFGLEFFVFGDQFGAAAELAGNPFPQASRQVGDPVGVHQHQRRLFARGLEQSKRASTTISATDSTASTNRRTPNEGPLAKSGLISRSSQANVLFIHTASNRPG
jgi:hypothetical protein